MSLRNLRFAFFVITLVLPFFSYSMCEQKDIQSHPLMDQENMQLLFKIAQHVSDTIDDAFPMKKQVLVGLGQSPAYLLEMIKFIGKERLRSDRSYMHVAFSGSYFSGKEIDFYLLSKYRENASHYEQYLKQKQLSNEDLKMSEAVYIILEVCHSCNGLVSFLSFFKDYQIKPFIIYLQHDVFDPAQLGAFAHKRIRINDVEEKLLVELANADSFKDRLVPQFRFYAWERLNPLEFSPEENAPLIIEKIQNFVKNYYESKSQLNETEKKDTFKEGPIIE